MLFRSRHTATGSGPGTGGYKVLFATGAVFFLLGAAVLRRANPRRAPSGGTGEAADLSTRLAVR